MDLIIKNLNKTYSGGIRALKNINLSINKGMFGLLGPNGAGKSTLMRILATLQEADEGSTITLDEIDVLKQKEIVRGILGYLPQEFGVYPKIEAEALLDHIAALKGVLNRGERRDLVSALLQKTNLWAFRKNRLETFSGGMKQRFGVAQALIANPQLIIVDEPTAGLDPAERSRFLNLLSEIGENTIVILSTHIVEDVKELCSDMAIINSGILLYKGEPAEAITEVEGKVWRKRIDKFELEEYRKNHTVLSVRLIAGLPEIHIFSDAQPDQHFERVRAGLEDVYFAYVLDAANQKKGYPVNYNI